MTLAVLGRVSTKLTPAGCRSESKSFECHSARAFCYSNAVIADYLDQCRTLVDTVAAQEDAIAEAAALFSETILAGRMVHLFGSGHSRILVEEMWPRYGSFPGFNPIVELSLSFHNLVVGANGQRQAMFLENVHGLAARILRNYDISQQDTALIASSSGCNLVPIEMAEEFKRRGVKVVAIISKAHSEASRTQRRDGRKLQDFADIVLDTGAPAGDAMIEVPGLETPVAPGSTVGGCMLINAIKAEVAALLTEAGQPPKVLTAPALVGRDRATELFESAYDEHARRLAKLYANIGENPRPERPERGPRSQRRGDREERPERDTRETRENQPGREERGERGDRGERRERGGRDDRQSRPERGEFSPRPERESREPRDTRENRESREPRERRDPRPDRSEAKEREEYRPTHRRFEDEPAPVQQEEAHHHHHEEEEAETAPAQPQEVPKPANWDRMDDIERRLWLRENGQAPAPQPRSGDEGDREQGGRRERRGGGGGGRGHRGGRGRRR